MATDFAADCTQHLPKSKLRDLLKDAIEQVLLNEYVFSEYDPEVVYQSINGSGIGLKFSSLMASLAFYKRAEKARLTVPRRLISGVVGY